MLPLIFEFWWNGLTSKENNRWPLRHRLYVLVMLTFNAYFCMKHLINNEPTEEP